jgi:hypothetical protein
MGPILFYMSGLKEAHEAGSTQLKGPDAISESITEASITFLMHVKSKTFIPHMAEIDYIDEHHPMVLLFPAQPLFHNDHYAVAVVNALDLHGMRLPPTGGMQTIHESFKENPRNSSVGKASSLNTQHGNTSSMYDTNRLDRYRHQIIPSLEEASSFRFNYTNDPLLLQLLFDFHTISASSQLGPIRYVRDTTMKIINASNWDWTQHVRTNQIINYNCTYNTCGNGCTMVLTKQSGGCDK